MCTSRSTRSVTYLYEYKFVKVDLDGFLMQTKKPKENYHKIIEEYAKIGWRFVQVFAPAVSVVAGGIPTISN